MTKKDFELIARVLRESEAGALRTPRAYVLGRPDTIACAFADELAATNPRFKRDLFLRACGVDS